VKFRRIVAPLSEIAVGLKTASASGSLLLAVTDIIPRYSFSSVEPMAIMKGRFSLAVIGFVLGAALSYRAELLAEDLPYTEDGALRGLLSSFTFYHLRPTS
jgi:hypothetical protein